ncbi:Small nuclear RNA activating complex, polypeptide 1, 43kDa [Polyrhizophydium stewartii]|uniref:Small nuclear RNA activating complex, polypeptide 1, 43kDa n=1 Tax=Polyrhizophydium stewartii TaxID=2732419 RepID=A0ABR4NGQ3_9FUNG
MAPELLVMSQSLLKKAAVVSDVRSLIGGFCMRMQPSLNEFRQVWLALGFSRIHSVASDEPSRRRLIDFAYETILTWLHDGASIMERCAVVFSLYALFWSQPSASPPVLISLSPDQMRSIIDAHQAFQPAGYREAALAITSLIDCHAFKIVIYGPRSGASQNAGQSPSTAMPIVPAQRSRSGPAPGDVYEPPQYDVRELMKLVFNREADALDVDSLVDLSRAVGDYTRLKNAVDIPAVIGALKRHRDVTDDFMPVIERMVKVPQAFDPNLPSSLRAVMEDHRIAKRLRMEAISAMGGVLGADGPSAGGSGSDCSDSGAGSSAQIFGGEQDPKVRLSHAPRQGGFPIVTPSALSRSRIGLGLESIAESTTE